MRSSFKLESNRIVSTSEDDAPIRVFVNPDAREREYLTHRLNIDEHTLGSALDPDELSRIEYEPDHIAIIFKRPRNYSAEDRFLFKSSSTGVFLFRDFIVIVQHDEQPLFDGKQFNHVESLHQLLLKLLYRSINHFREHLRIISMISDELQGKINTSMENSHLLNMFAVGKSLEYYLNSINSNSLLLERLKIHAKRIGFTEEETELLDDILVENGQCSKQAEIYSNILASLMDARASIVSNNINVLMKRLNLITIAIMVPTFVVSTFSMNLRYPMDLEQNQVWFWFIMLIALVCVLAFIWVWRTRKW